MIQAFDEPVSVILSSVWNDLSCVGAGDHPPVNTLLHSVGATRHGGSPAIIKPISVDWAGRTYEVSRVGLHHKYKTGDTLYHVFSVVTSGVSPLFFRLLLNTDTLLWRLQEVSDGLP